MDPGTGSGLSEGTRELWAKAAKPRPKCQVAVSPLDSGLESGNTRPLCSGSLSSKQQQSTPTPFLPVAFARRSAVAALPWIPGEPWETLEKKNIKISPINAHPPTHPVSGGPAEAVDAALHYARTYVRTLCWPIAIAASSKAYFWRYLLSSGPFHGRLFQRRDKDQTLALRTWYLPYRALTGSNMQCDRLASSSHPKQAVSSLHQDDASWPARPKK